MRLSIDNLCFSYGTRPILRGVSFSADVGERIALLGPNGCGKTTFFRCILRLIENYSGTITLDDDNTASLTPQALARRIAYIPQSTSPTFNYCVRDVVLMGLTGQLGLLQAPNRAQEDHAQQLLDELGIGHLSHRGYARLSGGERQLVLLARALAQDAQTLIMDEPTASLDLKNQFQVMDRVMALSEQGYTILFSTHHPDQASLFASRVLALYEGKVLIDTPPAQLTEAALSQLYRTPLSLQTLSFAGRTVSVCLPGKLSEEKE